MTVVLGNWKKGKGRVGIEGHPGACGPEGQTVGYHPAALLGDTGATGDTVSPTCDPTLVTFCGSTSVHLSTGLMFL